MSIARHADGSVMFFRPPQRPPPVDADTAARRVKGALLLGDEPLNGAEIVEATHLSWNEVDDGLLVLRKKRQLKTFPSKDSHGETFTLREIKA